MGISLFKKRFHIKFVELCILLTFLTYFLGLSIMTVTRHHRFLTTASDLGIFNQAFWTTLHGEGFFYETPDFWFNPNGSFFGVHFAPILFLFLPFYAIYPAPDTLLVIQAFFIALAIIPIYLISRDRIGKYSLCAVLLYVLYTPMFFVSLFDFHLEAFVPVFLLFMVYFFDKKKYSLYFVSVVLALSTIEFVPLITATFGMCVILRVLFNSLRRHIWSWRFLKDKESIYGFLTVLLSVLWFFVALQVKKIFNPHASPVPSQFAHLLNPSEWSTLYVYLEKYLDEKLLYVILLFGPLVFLSFLSPLDLAPVVPWFLMCFLSDYAPYFIVRYQYSAFTTAFIFYSMIKSVRKLSVVRDKIDDYRIKRIMVLLIVVSLLFATYAVEKYDLRKNLFGSYSDEHIELLNYIISLIPEDASVLAQNDIFPHISGRKNAYVYLPSSSFEPDYIIFDISLTFYRSPPPYPPYCQFIPKYLKEHTNYGIYASADGILLYKRDYVGDPVFYIPYVKVFNYRDLKLGAGRIVYDSMSYSKRVLFHSKNDSPGVFWFGPYAVFPPGNYTVIFRLKISEIVNDTVIILDVASNLGSEILAKKVVNGSEFLDGASWQNFTLTFVLDVPKELEIRGIYVSNKTNVYLDFIIIKQFSTGIRKLND